MSYQRALRGVRTAQHYRDNAEALNKIDRTMNNRQINFDNKTNTRNNLFQAGTSFVEGLGNTGNFLKNTGSSLDTAKTNNYNFSILDLLKTGKGWSKEGVDGTASLTDMDTAKSFQDANKLYGNDISFDDSLNFTSNPKSLMHWLNKSFGAAGNANQNTSADTKVRLNVDASHNEPLGESSEEDFYREQYMSGQMTQEEWDYRSQNNEWGAL